MVDRSTPYTLDRPDIVFEAVTETLWGTFPTLSYEALLTSDRINAATAWMRQVGMYVMSRRLGVSPARTGQFFERDRTTVSHAVQLVEQEIADRPATAAFLDFLEGQARAALDRKLEAEQRDGGYRG